MPTGHRRPTLRTAALGLLVGVVLLLGAVLDGGLVAPTRVEVREATSAHVADADGAVHAATHRDGPTVDVVRSAHPAPAVAGVVAAVAGLIVVRTRRAPTVPRSLAGRAARHRGPPLAA